jgi:26S proteasome regulatory subunit (ATPase 3-interacting protein)
VRTVQTLEAEKAEIETRLANLRAGKAKKVTAVERAEGEKAWRVSKAVRGRREKIAREMWKVIEEVVGEGERRGELREALGLDE